MIIYDILSILQYQVSTTVVDYILYCILYVFMLALLCFCVATEFSVNKDLYIVHPVQCTRTRRPNFYCTENDLND